jgi:hypothetical protein
MLLVLFLALYVPVLCLPFKFGGAFFYALPELTRSLGIVNLVTLWAMCHFKFGGGVDFSGEPFCYFVFVNIFV